TGAANITVSGIGKILPLCSTSTPCDCIADSLKPVDACGFAFQNDSVRTKDSNGCSQWSATVHFFCR
ncbi:MAG: hypothetical protein JWN04_1063, partial [Myxococcaceae bacterium]|nr:hypothetical protein [Myxococcaceae bacterium]